MILPGFPPGLRPGLRFLAGVAPILFDFAGNSFPVVSVSRAQAAYVEDLAGNLTLVAANTLRRSNRGALIESAATNGIRNNSMQGAATGTPGTLPTNWAVTATGGLNRDVVSIATVNGVDCIDLRFYGTPTTASTNLFFEPNNIIAAAQNQTWTSSASLALVGGSLTNITAVRLTVLEYAGASTVASTNAPVLINSTLQRYSVTRTLTGATSDSVRPGMSLVLTVGQPVDITIRIALPQTELGAFATSPIRTTGAAATRAADAVSITIPSGYSSIRYTLDDATTQDVVVSPGQYTIPTNIGKYIAKMELRP